MRNRKQFTAVMLAILMTGTQFAVSAAPMTVSAAAEEAVGYGAFDQNQVSLNANSSLDLLYQYYEDQNQPVEGAQIFISESGDTEPLYDTGLKTDNYGKITLSFNIPGNYTIEARYPGSESGDRKNAVCQVNVTGDSGAAGSFQPSDAALKIIQAVEALPSSGDITLADQYELEAVKWSYKKTAAKNKKMLGVDTKSRLEAADQGINRILESFEVSPVTENTTLNWSQFLGNEGLKGVSDGKSPRTASEITLKWEFNISGFATDWDATPGTPIVVGDYTYCYVGEELRKFRTSDGVQVASAEAPGSAMFFINLAYGDGKIFVPRYNRGKSNLMVYDADTLELLGTSSYLRLGTQCEGQTSYHDGYVYLCTYGQPAMFACFKVSDFTGGAVSVDPVWTMERPDTSDGFAANVGAAFVGDTCIFATSGSYQKDNPNPSTIYSVDAKTGEVISSFKLPGQEHVSSTLVYYEANNRLYIAASGNPGCVVRSYEVLEDGSLDQKSMKAYISDVEDGGTQSTPVIYNGRLYLGGGGKTMGSEEPFRVIDAYTMEEIYRIDEIITKGTPTLTTAYATAENQQTVYLYLVPYAPEMIKHDNNSVEYINSYLYIVKDSIGQTEPSFEKLEHIGTPEFASQSVIIDKDGNLIFYNDAKGLYCYGRNSDTSITREDVNQQVARLPKPEEYRYYNRVEIARIRERSKVCGISDEMDRKLSNIEEVLSLEGSGLNAYIRQGLHALSGKLTEKDAEKVYYLWQLAMKNSGVLAEEDVLLLEEKKQDMDKKIQNGPLQNTIDAIHDIPERITSSDESVIAYAWSLYRNLDGELQGQVTNFARLQEAQERLSEIKQWMSDFKKQLDDLYQLNTSELSDREKLNQAVAAVDAASDQLRKVKEMLPDEDDERVQKMYEDSVVSYKKNEIIKYLLENVLLPEGRFPEITKENADALIADANLVQRFYSEFTQEDKEMWNHDGDMKKLDKLLQAIDKVKQGTKKSETEKTSETGSSSKAKNVKTGDNSQPFAWIASLAGASGILILLIWLRRRRKAD